jgi:hypothetical protein
MEWCLVKNHRDNFTFTFNFTLVFTFLDSRRKDEKVGTEWYKVFPEIGTNEKAFLCLRRQLRIMLKSHRQGKRSVLGAF